MAYSELIKRFSGVRRYMREFFVYGFRSREEFPGKSARSYDNERRRIESWLGDYLSFRYGKNGKNVFFSMDSRTVEHNPLYQAFLAKSFTARDITLHFFLLDILKAHGPCTLNTILDEIDIRYLASFRETMPVDESTVRKKLDEYTKLGLVQKRKKGRTVLYSLCESAYHPAVWEDALHFFSEENPLGVIGFFLLNRNDTRNPLLRFRNHFFMNVCDSEIMESALQAIHEERIVTICQFSGRTQTETVTDVIPVQLYAGANGRNYLMCLHIENDRPVSFRIDYIRDIKRKEQAKQFSAARQKVQHVLSHTWGVSFEEAKTLQHIEMDIRVGETEPFVVDRLNREKRCGSVKETEKGVWRFSADVYDAYEMVPWIRTFTGRILRLACDNDDVTKRIADDLAEMKRLYEVQA